MLESYLGIDVHKRRCVYTEIDKSGKVIQRGSFNNNYEELSDFVSKLHGNEHVVVEPVLNYLWLLDHIEPAVASIHVATPYKVRVIAESKSKTDKYDSRILAELLRTNFLPESWIPPRHIRYLRQLVRQRYRMVRTAVMYKNYIRHLLFLHGVHLKVTDISSVKARREIKRLLLPEYIRNGIQQCHLIITELSKLQTDLNDKIKQEIKDVKEVDLLLSIPGVGWLWAATIYSEVGNIERFRNAKAFANYTGLVPIVRSSGDSTYLGGITHMGSKLLRNAFVEVAIKAYRKSTPLNRLYHRITYRSNSQKAKVAVARKIAVISYTMLKKHELFRSDI